MANKLNSAGGIKSVRISFVKYINSFNSAPRRYDLPFGCFFV